MPPYCYVLQYDADSSSVGYSPYVRIPFQLGQALKQQLDEVDRLNFYLFKAVQRPLVNPPLSVNLASTTSVQKLTQ